MVHFAVERRQPPARLHVLVRLLCLFALAAIGWSSLSLLVYLLLPVVAAALIGQKGAARFFDENAGGYARALRWLAGFFAYAWLLTDEIPLAERLPSVHFAVSPSGTPTATSALVRLVASLPVVLLVFLFTVAAAMVWVVDALAILIARRVVFTNFLTVLVRLKLWLFAYHFSIVESYPSTSEERLTAA